ncbi:MAG TPA: MBL fold metallo-hydrolase [Lacibacter sp.]|nr:MBL fold metallo-hydrolase [Lacibacter sp.]HMO89403.1 MBL fold metallo-hydrolase [Lacibacter sp.]HMP88067.1 MBL fold metallo-hydrolase [Lacibacter sp.]
MNRKSFLRSSAFTLGYLALSNQRLLAGMLQRAPENIKMLTDEIGIFTDKGGTILFYLSKGGNVVVDAQWPEQAGLLIDEIKKKNNAGFELLINTHHHLDNTSGNSAFKGVVKNILAHENSKFNQIQNAKIMKAEGKYVYPDLTYKTSWSEKFGKEHICVYHYGAAHTSGDSIVHFERADILHMGDLVFNRRHAGIDRSGGANIKNWIEVLGKIYADFGRRTRFVYGRSGDGFDVVGNKEDLKAFSNYLSLLLSYVQTEIKRGKTRKEILKATAVPGTPEWRSGNIERTLAAVYEELTFEAPET